MKKYIFDVRLQESNITNGGFMELTNEDIVTKLLSSNEILHIKKNNNMFISNPICNLGEFLKDIKDPPSPYEEKYLFIR